MQSIRSGFHDRQMINTALSPGAYYLLHSFINAAILYLENCDYNYRDHPPTKIIKKKNKNKYISDIYNFRRTRWQPRKNKTFRRERRQKSNFAPEFLVLANKRTAHLNGIFLLNEFHDYHHSQLL